MDAKPKGRRGSSAHQRLINMASKRLLDEIIGENFLKISLVREQKLEVQSSVLVAGTGRLGGHGLVDCKVDLYADVACACVFDPKSDFRYFANVEPSSEELAEAAEKHRRAGNMEQFYELVRSAYGQMLIIIECELNPRSNLLRDGPRLTAYKLLRQKNRNLVLILAVYEGTKVDNPEVFDEIWKFPKKS